MFLLFSHSPYFLYDTYEFVGLIGIVPEAFECDLSDFELLKALEVFSLTLINNL